MDKYLYNENEIKEIERRLYVNSITVDTPWKVIVSFLFLQHIDMFYDFSPAEFYAQ